MSRKGGLFVAGYAVLIALGVIVMATDPDKEVVGPLRQKKWRERYGSPINRNLEA